MEKLFNDQRALYLVRRTLGISNFIIYHLEKEQLIHMLQSKQDQHRNMIKRHEKEIEDIAEILANI